MKKTTAIFGFYGESNTGKTTLLTRIIKRLAKEGYQIATIKKTNKKIEIDVPGKDTWKYAQAGSQLVIFSALNETDYLIKNNQNEKEIIDNISHLWTYDVIFIEGAQDITIPKIRLGNISKRKNTIYTYKGDFDSLLNMIKKEINSKQAGKVTLKVNGRMIPLSDFPSQFIKDTIVGMLKSLKNVDDEIKSVEIQF